jgi:hypothetical protein
MEATIPYNGSGTFNRLYSWVVDAANNINISSSRTDAEMNGFAAGLTNCITRDGQSPPSADIPWGGKRLMNIAAAAAGTDALNRDTADARYILTTATSVSLAGSLTAAGLITANSGIVIAASGLTVQAGGASITGATSITGTFTASGVITANSGLVIATAGMTVQAGGITVTGNSSVTGTLSVTSTATAATPTVGDNSTKLATTAFIVTSFAPLASPALTGTPTAPTAAVNTNTTQIATTAYVMAAKAPTGQNISSAATITPNATDDLIAVTALAANVTIANPTSTPADGWGTVIRLKDNGTSRTIAYGTQYRAVGTSLPTATVANKNLYLGCIWNNADTKFDVVSVAQE